MNPESTKARMLDLSVERFESPLGEILLVSDGQALRALDFVDHEARMMELLGRYWGDQGGLRLTPMAATHTPSAFRRVIERYLAGELDVIDSVRVNTGGTPFQQAVWQALRTIPVGATWSYGQLARHLGRPNGARAVGLANGANPVSIVVPCHRVIGSGGALTGYGGGLPRKRWLLSHEAGQPRAAAQEQRLLWA